jgi:hypothetical protein
MRNWKLCGRKRSFNFKAEFGIHQDGLIKATKILSQDGRNSSRDSNWASPKYKSEALLAESGSWYKLADPVFVTLSAVVVGPFP